MLRRNAWFRALIVLLVVAAGLHVSGLLWDLAMRFGDIIMLFALAWMFAFVLRPLARSLHLHVRVPWGLSVAFIYLLFFGAVFLLGLVLIPILVTQIAELVNTVPTWAIVVQDWYTNIQGYLPEAIRVENLPATFGQGDLVAPLQQVATSVLQNALGVFTGLATLLFDLVIVLILSFYIALDGDRIGRGFLNLVPDEHEATVYFLSSSLERSFGGFLRGQAIQALIYASGTALVMVLAGVGYIALATTIAAIAMIIPFVGPLIAIIPPIILAALEGSLSTVLFVTVALLILQQIVFNVIAPKVMSEAVGIHPLLVFAAILIGSKVAGVAGAIFGVPVAAVIAAMAGFFYQRMRGQTSLAARPVPADVVAARDPEAPCGGLHGFWHWACLKLLRR